MAFLSHPIGSAKLPQRVEPERLDELTQKLRSGTLSRAEEDELVSGHTRLLLSLAQKWSVRAPHLADVFVADGLFAILMAIRTAGEKLRPGYSLTQYITIKIVTAFRQAVIKQSAVRSPYAGRKTVSTVKKGDKEYKHKTEKILKRHNLPLERSRIDGDGDLIDLPARIAKDMLPRARAALTEKMDRVELREIFDLACKDSYEKAILELRKHGYTLAEIAEQLHTNRQKIAAALSVIEDRLRGLLK